MCSLGGTSKEKILDLDHYATSALYDPAERAALAYADSITLSDTDVDDVQFAELRDHYDDDQIIELTAVIAWENASAKFNRALRIGSQGLWTQEPT